MGGLSRKATKIKEIAATRNLPFLLVDAGNLLFEIGQENQSEAQRLAAADGIADILRHMNYDAVGVGPYDLEAGLDFFKARHNEDVPWVCANVYDSSGNLVFTPYRSRTIDNIRVAFLGITDPPVVGSKEFSVTDGAAELQRLVPIVAENHDLIIILAGTTFNRGKEIAEQLDASGIVITADLKKGNAPPKLINTSIITQTTSRGKYLGALAISWKHRPWQDETAKRLAGMEDKLKNISLKINDMSSVTKKDDPVYVKKKAVLEQERQRRQEELKTLRERLDIQDQPERSSFTNEFVLLSTSIKEDPAVQKLVDTIEEHLSTLKRDEALRAKE